MEILFITNPDVDDSFNPELILKLLMTGWLSAFKVVELLLVVDSEILGAGDEPLDGFSDGAGRLFLSSVATFLTLDFVWANSGSVDKKVEGTDNFTHNLLVPAILGILCVGVVWVLLELVDNLL